MTGLPVLVGVDDALLALRVGVAEARLRGLPLHLVSAFAAPPPEVLPEAPWQPRDSARARVMRAAGAVNAAYPSIDLDARVVRGDLAEILTARSRHGSLVVVAGEASAQRVASRSAVPVFVVPPHPTPPGGPVVVGLSGGAASDALLEFAFDDAALRGVPLRAVHLDHERWDEAERLLAEALAGWPAKYPDVEIDRRAVQGPDVERGIVSLTHDASMVVAAARSRLETGERVLGPITTGLLRDARCPVVVIPADDGG